MDREPNLTEAMTELKRNILTELEPYLLPIVVWLAKILNR